MKKTSSVLLVITLFSLSCSVGESDDLKAVRNTLVMLTVLQAKNSGKENETDTLFAENTRVWFETKEGEGTKLSSDGSGPWADWNKFFNAEKIDQNIKAYPESVVVFESEQNDFYQLIERKPKPMAITYYFDDKGKISGKLVVGIKTIPFGPDRLAEATAWLLKEYPDDLKTLIVDGEIVPSLDNAKLWKKRLNEWRTAVKLDTL